MFMNILHDDLIREIGFQPEGEILLIAKDPWIAVRYDDILPIVTQKKFAKRYTSEDGKRKQQFWTASLVEGNDQKIILTVDGLFTKHWELDRQVPTQSQIDCIMDVYAKRRSAYWSAENEPDETPETAAESFHAYVTGNASQFAFILSDLYAITKQSKTNDVLKMGNFYFPLLPIQEMIRTCPDKTIRWDAKLTISDDNCPVLHVEFHDVVKTIVNFKGSCSLSDVKINPRSRTIQTVYEWELSRKFFAPFTTETAAEIATETPETAVQDTPQPDPVVLATETPETTPEPEILAVPVPAAVFPTKTTPKPRKRRQTANVIKNDTFWALCRDIAKIILDEAKTAVIAR